MTKREQSAERLFGEALDLAPSRRSAFLDKACKGDPELRRLVDELLRENDRAGGFLSGPIFNAGGRSDPSDGDAAGLASGTRLNRYSIIEPLGQGGMGVVYRSWDEKLERTVAIKVLSHGVLVNEDGRRRFHKEALALAKLSHSQIAAVYDVGDQDGIDFIVMECVSGQSLAARLKPGPLAVADATSIVLQIAQALEEAHEKGVIHRDLKPANVMVTAKGQVKVLDFGIAKLFATGTAPTSVTMTRGLIGTPLYMSPEQAHEREVDARTDLWSLGIVYYEALTGETPFFAEGSIRILRAITERPHRPVLQLRPDAPEMVEQIVSRALEKDPDLRYQSAQEFIRDLSELLAGLTPAAKISASPARGAPAAKRAPGAAAPSPASGNSAARHRIRIAMVPIEPIGGGTEDYFAAGLTDDMISALSHIDPARLRVTAGPRLLHSELLGEQLERLRRELDLDYVLRGSVRRSADTLRISAHLHDLRDKSVLWSETYDRKSSDLLAVQDEVTKRVSQSLALELLPGSAIGSRKYAGSPAYDAYLKGRFFWHKMTSDGIRNSMTYFTDAISLDPGFAPAYSGLADCYLQMGSGRVGTMKPLDALARARPLLQRAMDLDDTMAEAHCTFGLLKSWYDLDWAGAEREFKIALSLDASHLTTLLWQSLYLCAMGRHEEAVASVTRAREADPLSPVMNIYVGAILNFSAQYDLALHALRQAMELDPHAYRAHFFVGIAYTRMGRLEEAIEEFKRSMAMNPDNLESISYMGQAMAERGDRDGALRAMDQLVKAAEGRTEPALLMSLLYASLGDEDQMYRCLYEARDRKCVPLYLVVLNENLRRYQADPRYLDFLRSIGLSRFAAV